MNRRLRKIAALFLTMSALGGCTAESGAGSASDGGSTASSPDATLAPSGTPNSSNVVDVNLEPLFPIEMDIAIDVDDPAAVADASSEVVAGTVISTDSTSVDSLGVIDTYYTLKVDKVYKGDLKVGDKISVSLPGGSMTLGDYITELDRIGRYDDNFPVKSEEFMKEHGIDPSTVVDPRDQDPNTLVTQNFGNNPTSESQNAEIDPDAWIYFLDEYEEGGYYGSVLNYSFKYLKGGYVYSLNIRKRSRSEGQALPRS